MWACECVFVTFIFFFVRVVTADVHLLHKVSGLSPTITFGFHSFLHLVCSSPLLGFRSDCHKAAVDSDRSAELVSSLPYNINFSSHVCVNLLCDAKKPLTKLSYALIRVTEVHSDCRLALVRLEEAAGAALLDCLYV